jgi:hypothetical protein
MRKVESRWRNETEDKEFERKTRMERLRGETRNIRNGRKRKGDRLEERH